MPRQESSVMMEGAKIIFRNFAGAKTQYNAAGDRNFCVLIDQDLAAKMHADGWPIKVLRQKEEGDPEQPFMKVKVKYDGPRPPRVVMITSRGRNTLDEEMVSLLDWADIDSVDLICVQYHWEMNGKTGITAYLKSMYVVINESPLDIKYSELDEVGTTNDWATPPPDPKPRRGRNS